MYDNNGNIVCVVIAQLNKPKFAKMTGSMPENVNFGIKPSTVRPFIKTGARSTGRRSVRRVSRPLSNEPRAMARRTTGQG